MPVWRKNTWCLVLGIFLILIFSVGILSLASLVSAVRINEIEINPLEGASGKEWIELYNDKTNNADISGWKIYDGLAKPTNKYTIPQGTIIGGGNYYVIELNNARTLNNDGDFITLYDSSEKQIDETETLKELKSSSKTWQFCQTWQFVESTKGEKNNCEEKQQNSMQDNETNDDNENNQQQNQQNQTNQEIQNNTNLVTQLTTKITSNTIKLNPKNIKTEVYTSKSEKIKYFAIYGFALFCVLVIILLILKRI